jgi:hypothetical protein
VVEILRRRPLHTAAGGGEQEDQRNACETSQIGSRWTRKGRRYQNGTRLPPVK